MFMVTGDCIKIILLKILQKIPTHLSLCDTKQNCIGVDTFLWRCNKRIEDFVENKLLLFRQVLQ